MDRDNHCDSTSVSCGDVELHLDTLNYTATKLNELEKKLMVARNEFNDTLSKRASHLQRLSNRLGKWVHHARPYYDACDKRAVILNEIQHATEAYDKSSVNLSIYRKEFNELQSTVSSKQGEGSELIAQLLQKINVAKKETMDAGSLHENLLASYHDLEIGIKSLKKENRISIKISQPYFAARIHFAQSLKECKERVEAYTENVSLCKSLYSGSMAELERLSMSLHAAKQSAASKSPTTSGTLPSSPLGEAELATPKALGSPNQGQGSVADSCDLPGDEEGATASQSGCSRSTGDLFTQLPAIRHCTSVYFNWRSINVGNSCPTAILPLLRSSQLVDALLLPSSGPTYTHEQHLSRSHRFPSECTTATTTTSSSLEQTSSSASDLGLRVGPGSLSCPPSPMSPSATAAQQGNWAQCLVTPLSGRKCSSPTLSTALAGRLLSSRELLRSMI